MISVHPTHALSIQEFKNEIEGQILQERLKTLVGHLQFLLKSPDYKWQYNTTGGIISNSSPSPELLDNYEMKKNVLLMKLGSESDKIIWEESWNQLQILIQPKDDQLAMNLHCHSDPHFFTDLLHSILGSTDSNVLASF